MIHRAVLIALLAPAGVSAQAAFDRTKPPTLPATPKLMLPSVTTSKLSNGIGLQVVTQTEVPLVQVTLTVAGGARLDGAEPGRASFMARIFS